MNGVVDAVALVVHDTRSAAQEVARDFVREAAARGITAYEWRPGEALPAEVDVVVGVGGDGTLLTRRRVGC